MLRAPNKKLAYFNSVLRSLKQNPNVRHFNQLEMTDILVLSEKDMRTLRDLVISAKNIDKDHHRELNEIYQKEKEQMKLMRGELFTIQKKILKKLAHLCFLVD